MLEKYEIWLRNVAKKSDGTNYSDKTAYKYSASINIIKKEFNINFLTFDSFDKLFELKDQLYSNYSFVKKNTKGNKMYSRAIEMFISFICESGLNDVFNNIKNIENDNLLSYDEKNEYIETICNMRNQQFQRNFKKELLNEFNCRCALCGINNRELLIASHIIPYSEYINKSDMYRSYNGLLLCPIHDALFDKHLISFSGDGTICIKKNLDERIYDFLNINENIKLDEKYLMSERKECMKIHNERFNKN